jgi:hypothetical protein
MRSLKDLVDWTPYIPPASSPSWLSGLATIASSQDSVLALLGPSGIRATVPPNVPVRLVPDPAALFLVGLAGRASGTDNRLAVGLPPVGRHLPLLLGAASLLAATVAGADTKGRGILVVSPDLQQRSNYCNLRVGNQSIDNFYPGNRLLPTGKPVAIKKGANSLRHGASQGITFFLPLLNLPKTIGVRVSLIVLDLRLAKWVDRAGDLAQWAGALQKRCGVIALYTVGDPTTREALVAAKYVDMPLDDVALNTCNSLLLGHAQISAAPIDWSIGRAASYTNHANDVRVVPARDELIRTIDEIGILLTECRELDTPDLRRARWLGAMFRSLCMPLESYETAASLGGARTLHYHISRIGSLSRDNPELGPVVQSLRMLFTRLYMLAGESNPKAVEMQKVLSKIRPSDGGTLIVVRDRVGELATQSWCEALRTEGKIACMPVISSCASFGDAQGDQHNTTIFPGLLHRRYAWISSADLGNRVIWLSYRGEVDAIKTQLGAMQGDEARRARRDWRLAAISYLGSHRALPREQSEAVQPELRISVSPPQKTGRESEPQKLKTIQTGGFKGLADALRKEVDILPVAPRPSLGAGARLDDDSPLDAASVDIESPQDLDDDVVVVTVQSERSGRRSVHIPATEMVEVARYRPSMDLLRIEASALQVGDILLLTQGERRVSLFDEIVGLAEQQPHLAFLHHYRQKWRATVALMATHFSNDGRLDYSKMLESVREHGSPVTTELTLRSWVKEERIGPDALESIVAVGRMTGVDEVASDAVKFDRAFRRLRGIRAGIGRRLNTSLRGSFARAMSGAEVDIDDSETFDDQLDLPADELIAAIDPSEILDVARPTEAGRKADSRDNAAWLP